MKTRMKRTTGKVEKKRGVMRNGGASIAVRVLREFSRLNEVKLVVLPPTCVKIPRCRDYFFSDLRRREKAEGNKMGGQKRKLNGSFGKLIKVQLRV